MVQRLAEAMNRLVTLLAVALLLTTSGGALAQGGTGPNLEVRVDPLGELLEPGDDGVATTVTVRTSCQSLSGSRTVDLTAEDLPAWVEVEFDPTTVTLRDTACPGAGNVTATSTLHVAATRDAPARLERTLRVIAESQDGARDGAILDVEAAYFNDIELDVPGVKDADPGEAVELSVTFTNLGNAPTTVYVSRVNVPSDVRVAMPGTTTVASLQRGAGDNTVDVTFTVTAPEDFPWTDRTDTLSFRAQSWLAWDRTVEGEDQSFDLQVHTRGVYVPAPLIALVVLGLLSIVVIPLARDHLAEKREE